MKNKIFAILLFVFSFFPLVHASAQVDIGVEYGEQTGLSYADPRITAANIIKTGLGILGIIVTVIIMYAGFKWMTAGGNDDDIASAKKMITAAVIGLVIILSSYAITTFVISSLYKSTAGVDLDI